MLMHFLIEVSHNILEHARLEGFIFINIVDH